MRLIPLTVIVAVPTLFASEQSDFFEKEVRPVLAKNCFACHTATALGNLSMTSGEALRKGGNSGPAIMPGQPDESLLIQAVAHTHPRLKMPPSGKLSDAEIGALKKWIADGAVWPDSAAPKLPQPGQGYQITADQRAFWSFQPVKKPAYPR